MEEVFVVPRSACFGGAWPQGFHSLHPGAARELVHEWRRHGFFMPRPAAEADPSHKQVIPYCTVTRGSDIFVTRRRKQGSEQRLHGSYSIGLGGHVGPEDGAPEHPETLRRGLLRELHEELVLPSFPDEALQVVGWCNDDSNQVGSVHVGLVFQLDLNHSPLEPPVKVQVRENHKLEGGFERLVELLTVWQDSHRFETWSQLVLEQHYKLPQQGSSTTSTSSE